MSGEKALAIMCAGLLLVGGLGILVVAERTGMRTESPSPDNPNDSTSVGGVIRTDLCEDYTNWKCGPCVPQNAAWAEAIRAIGVGKVAPNYVHVNWPGANDPVYLNSTPNSNSRWTHYCINGVPACYVDGVHTRNGQGASYYQGLMVDRLAVASPMTIETDGSINNGTRAGTIHVRITAKQDLPAADRRVIVNLWEANVTRPLWNGTANQYPYPNGETVLEWATWKMYPNGTGWRIWTTGASAGSTKDYWANFTCNSDWVLNNVGATVMVQNWFNWDVEQAAVELFKGPQAKPAHDVGVFARSIPKTNVPAHKSVTMNCTVDNFGTSTETNVVVKMLLNGVLQSQLTVPSIAPGVAQYVSFSWTTPLNAGTYTVRFNVTAVSGETLLSNNQQDTAMTVVRLPEAGVSPPSLLYNLQPGRNGYNNITVSNQGHSTMFYNVTIGKDTTDFGPVSGGNYSTFLDRGNIYKVTSNTTLFEIRMYMGIFPTSIPLYFFVYESSVLSGPYTNDLMVSVPSSGTGWQWYSSGPINFNLVAGKYYLIGETSGNNNIRYYYNGVGSVPIATPFGTLETSNTFTASGMPPPSTINIGSTDYLPQTQRLVTGVGDSPWLTASPMTGTVNNVTAGSVMVKANATGLAIGTYRSQVTITTNDPYKVYTRVPVTLNVQNALSAAWFNATVNATGWNLVSMNVTPTGSPSLAWTFTDQANGGAGLVQWNRLMWYDARTPSNPWKQYSTGWNPALNDLTSYNWTRGVWIYVTSVGDGQICKGGTNWTYRTASVGVPLKAGWNMIGYPALNDGTYTVGQLKAATGATIVEGFAPSQTYRTVVLPDSHVMKKGRAYWVRVPADTVWNVNW